MKEINQDWDPGDTDWQCEDQGDEDPATYHDDAELDEDEDDDDMEIGINIGDGNSYRGP